MRMRLRQSIGLSLALLFVSGAAFAETAASRQSPKTKAIIHKAVAPKPKAAAKAGPVRARIAVRQFRSPPSQPAPAPDRYIGPTRTIGIREIGSAAWYGGAHIGLRTASGEPLDDVHATAAHRSLPLHSLARVTNLKNGRSTVVIVNDRGPTSPGLLIDLSPRAADDLDMRRDGVVPVSIEPVRPETASMQ